MVPRPQRSRHKSQGPAHKVALSFSKKCGRKLNSGLISLETFVTITFNFISFHMAKWLDV
jgi:hypothetical protein